MRSMRRLALRKKEKRVSGCFQKPVYWRREVTQRPVDIERWSGGVRHVGGTTNRRGNGQESLLRGGAAVLQPVIHRRRRLWHGGVSIGWLWRGYAGRRGAMDLLCLWIIDQRWESVRQGTEAAST